MKIQSLLNETQKIAKGIVFCSTKHGVDELTTNLLANGYQADALHGNLSQSQRDRVMARFRSGSLDLLVATDVAARGLDIDDVDVVINYDIPNDVENYVHRIGRTGRAGRSGKALTFVTPREHFKLKDIARYTKANIQRAQIPSRREVTDLKVAKLLEELRKTLEMDKDTNSEGKKLDRYAMLLESVANEETGGMDLAAALLKLLMERDKIVSIFERSGSEDKKDRSDRYDNDSYGGRNERSEGSGGRNESYGGRNERSESYGGRNERSESYGGRNERSEGSGGRNDKRGKQRSESRKMSRLFMNIGSKMKVGPGDIVGAITGESGLSGRLIGAIEIHDKFSFVEVPEEYVQEITQAMNKAQIRGVKIVLEEARPADAAGSKKNHY